MKSRATSIGLVLVAITSVQLGASLAKGLFPIVGSQGTTLLRCGIAALLLTLLWQPWKQRLDRRAIKAILLYGVPLGGMNLLFYRSIEFIPLGLAVGLEFTGPLAVALLGARRPHDFLWVVLAVLGILLILPLSDATAGMNMKGAAFALGAGFFWALYIIFGQKIGGLMPGGRAAAFGLLTATLVALPFGLHDAGSRLFDPSILPLAFLAAVLSSAVPFTLEMLALQRLPSRTFGILMSLEPAVAACTGLLMLGERLGATQWLAIACIITASAGSSLTSKH